jgi:hypothetical protein
MTLIIFAIYSFQDYLPLNPKLTRSAVPIAYWRQTGNHVVGLE